MFVVYRKRLWTMTRTNAREAHPDPAGSDAVIRSAGERAEREEWDVISTNRAKLPGFLLLLVVAFGSYRRIPSRRNLGG
jgi:hypothetical protein